MCCFFFNDTATTEIYTLSLHDALPICGRDWSRMLSTSSNIGSNVRRVQDAIAEAALRSGRPADAVTLVGDRKSTRLNSSHANISYAVFFLKKKKHINTKQVIY